MNRTARRAANGAAVELAEAVVDSPVGPLYLAATERGLAWLNFDGSRPGLPPLRAGSGRASRHLDEARRQLEEYFRGERREFDLTLDARGTAFQTRVWSRIAAIPYGGVASYAEVAADAGAPGAARAAGAACGSNPVAVVVPCHRVVGADGALHGFGGGLERKRWLLAHEGALLRLDYGETRARSAG